MTLEIDIPFRLDATGKVMTTSNPDRQIRNHVMSLINTEPGERAVITDYGVPLLRAVFESGDEMVASMLGETIRTAMSRWEPGIRLIRSDSVPGPDGDGIASVAVQYQRVDAPDNTVGSASTNFASIRVGGHVSETVRG